MTFPVPNPLEQNTPLPMTFRFSVAFLVGTVSPSSGIIPNPIDTLFQHVSGLDVKVETERRSIGGRDTEDAVRPKGIVNRNLVLQRGISVGSPLAVQAMLATGNLETTRMTVLVSMLDEAAAPLVNWMFMDAVIVGWRFADLNANADEIMIETVEFAYRRMQTLRV